MMTRRRRFMSSDTPVTTSPPTEEMLVLPCCQHKIGVDLDTPVGAEVACLFCGTRLILRGRPGVTARFFAIKDPP